MDTEFWRGKKVFLTGHTGFKGSWLSLWLRDMGAELTGYSLPTSSTASLFSTLKLCDDMTSLSGDINELAPLVSAMTDAHPDIVLHLAAQSLVRRSYQDPLNTFRTNVLGTANVLEAVRKVHSVKSVVVVTTDKCYENKEWVWGYRENDPLGGHDPYSASKACTELVAAAYRNAYFDSAQISESAAIATGRAGNVVGGGDWAEDRLLPDAIRAFSVGESVEIRNPQATRPWQHVLEPLYGYLLLAQRLYEDGSNFASGWNFGPPDDGNRSVGWVIDHIAQCWGDGARWHQDQQSHPHEANLLKLDCSKSASLLDWHPAWALEESLSRVVDWHKHHLQGADMKAYSSAEITDYLNTRAAFN